MQLFLIVFLPGLFASWLYFRNRIGWGHAIVAILVGSLVSYGVIYVLGNYVQADLIAETQRQLGDQLATDITNEIYGNALMYSVGALIGCVIAMKSRKNQNLNKT